MGLLCSLSRNFCLLPSRPSSPPPCSCLTPPYFLNGPAPRSLNCSPKVFTFFYIYLFTLCLEGCFRIHDHIWRRGELFSAKFMSKLWSASLWCLLSKTMLWTLQRHLKHKYTGIPPQANRSLHTHINSHKHTDTHRHAYNCLTNTYITSACINPHVHSHRCL